jgi:hypothetical protein
MRAPREGRWRAVDPRAAPAYTGIMTLCRIRHHAVALVAAYALAVQATLLAFVPIALAGPAIPFASALCSSAGSQPDRHPSRHDLPCAAMCTALVYGAAGTVPSAIAVGIGLPTAAVALASIDGWVSPPVAAKGPQAPRAPPLA